MPMVTEEIDDIKLNYSNLKKLQRYRLVGKKRMPLTEPNSNKNSKTFSLKKRLENNSIINLQISMNNSLLL